MPFKLTLLCLLLCLTGIACTAVQPTVLEYDFAMRTAVVPMEKDGRSYLQISGLCGHSAYAVEGVKIIDEGGTANVLVSIAPVSSLKDREKASGNFTALVPLSPQLTSVTFGKKKVTVWKP